jgi:poly(A) polymerase/tRNA nucleotidyltransferase (CCA-adding enzyme)
VTASARVTLDALGAGARELLRALGEAQGPGRPAWIVGGAVRDGLSGSMARDLDLTVPSGAIALARELAGRLGAAFLILDEARGAARMVGASGYAWRGPQVDFADFRAADLAGDLRGRDFTVNALAVPAAELLRSGEAAVEDPTGGLDDLRARLVRLCAPDSLEDDPVRVLRAARLAIGPGWALGGGIEEAAKRAAPGLSRVSAERARDELLGIFGEPASAEGLRLLDGWDALAIMLPELNPMKGTAQSDPHRFDVWEHSLRAVEGADFLCLRVRELEPWGDAFATHLDESLGQGVTRRGALKLAALLHDVAKPETRTMEEGRVRFLGHDVRGAERVGEIAARWRLSGRLAAVLERLVRQHLRPMHLAMAGAVTRRARYRFFRDLGDEALDLLLLSLADAAALRGDSPVSIWQGSGGRIVRELMAGHTDEARAIAAPPLIDGREAMEALGLGPGPELGRLLGLLREAQALGTVATREAAIAYLRRLQSGSLDTPEATP